MRREADVHVLAVHLALGVADAHRVGTDNRVDGVRAVRGDLVDDHHPGRPGVEQPDPGPDRASRIAVDFANYPDPRSMGLSALMAAGLVLFAMTLIVNTLGAVVIGRSRSGQATG